MGKRFTPDQTLSSEAVKALFGLINLGESLKPSNGALAKGVYEAVGNFLGQVFDGTWKYKSEANRYTVFLRRRLRKSKASPSIKFISFHKDELLSFIKIMEELQNEIVNGRYAHLFLVKMIDQFVSRIDLSEEWTKDVNNIWVKSPSLEDSIYKLGENGSERSLRLIDDAIKNIVKEKLHHGHYVDDELIVDSSRMRTFHVGLIPEFGHKLLPKSYKYFSDDVPLAEIHHFMDESSFIDIVRAILVYYHLAFDDFSRMKVCKYSPCSKLFFEKKKDSGIYCSDSCRVRANPEDKDRQNCRKRQNAWAVKRSPYTLQQSHCSNCDEYKDYKKGGDCIEIRERTGQAPKNTEHEIPQLD